MAFPPEFLDEIRARLPLAEVVGRRVQLKKRGREHEGLCPFHNEKTPSFTVSEAKGFYHCFGCGAHGDVIGFVMQSEGLAFPEAVERLAGEAGLALPETSPAEAAAAKRRATLHEVLEAACGWYQERLAAAEGRAARDYLAERGLAAETLTRFRLGFAPGQRGVFQKAMNAKGIDSDLLVEAGLLKRSEEGGPLRDYFFDRITFPIEDRRGRAVAFGGRAMGPSKAKYLNSPETALFHKGKVLYNLARARQAAHDTGELIVAEGYMDVIAMSQAGFQAAVAPLGTAVTEGQLAELWRLAAEPVFCLDGDAAGRRAALRAGQTALAGLEPGRSLRFALLPKGEDPDSLLAAQGPAALRRVLDAALGLSDLLWLAETEGRDLASPERRAGLWQALGRTMDTIASPEVRGAYRTAMEDRFERAFGYNPRTGRRAFRRGRQAPWRPGAAAGSRGPAVATLGTGAGVRLSPQALRRRQEQVLVATVVNHPELLIDYAEALAGLDLVGRDLRRLVAALVDLAADAPDLDTGALKCHLTSLGFSEVLEGLLSRQVYQLGPCARPETPMAQVRPNWAHFLALVREREVGAEAAVAADLLARDPNEESLARLRARQRSVEGGESKRVEFDALGVGDAGESN